MSIVFTCSVAQEEGVLTGVIANVTSEVFVVNSIDVRVKQDSEGDKLGITEGIVAAMIHLMAEPADQIVFEGDNSAEVVFSLMQKYMKDEVSEKWAVK